MREIQGKPGKYFDPNALPLQVQMYRLLIPWSWVLLAVKVYSLFADRALKHLDKNEDYF